VYQAFDHELGVGVAIKVIRPAAQADATAARDLELRFKRELVLARQITHKYVVRIHDIGDVDGVKYLTMPFIEGQTLADVLRRDGAMPVSRALTMARQVALGLAAAHDKGVIHRDLKPENIMIEKGEPPEGGDALIMDFGIARSVEHGATQTAAGSVIGTLEYMAPEQAQGLKVDQRADIYSFGLILYDALLGRQRLAGGDNPMSELLARMTKAPPAPRSIDTAIPDALDRIVQRCLEPAPDARFQTTGELAAALDALTPDGHVRSEPPAAPASVVAAGRGRWQLAAAALLIAAAGIGGWLVSNGGAPAAPAGPVEPISVLVADFQNNTGDSVFSGVLEQAFSLGIEGATFITAYPQRDALRSAAAIKAGSRLDEQTARLVAVRDGVTLVLIGSVGAAGSGYNMSVRAVDAVSGTEVAAAEGSAGAKSAVLTAVGEMATRLRRELGDTAIDTSESAREPFTTASLEAARAYVLGQELASAGKFNEAIVHYQEAVQLDPNFGRAYSGWANAAFRAGRPDEADQLWKKSITLMERMTEREKYRTLGGYYLGPGANDDQALENYRLLVEKYPFDGIGMNNLAVAYFRNLDFKRAYEQGEKAKAIYANGVTRSNLALYAMYASNFDAAAAEAKRALEASPFDKSYLPIAIAALAGGRPDEARAAYQEMAQVSSRGASIASMGRADIDMYLGRFEPARVELESGAASDDAGKLVAPRALKLIALAEIAAATRGGVPALSRLVSQATELSSADAVLVPAARLLIGAGRADAAVAHAAMLEKQVRKRSRAMGALIRAEMALAAGKPVEAIDTLTAARELADLWLVRFTLGRAYVEHGRFAEAIAEFEECDKRIGETADVFLDDWPTFRYGVPLKYWLARAQDGAGIKDSATKNYQAYLDLRSHVAGDALAADARKRLGR
jgi:tetratricopeptide (TPR) repeat protein